MWKMVNTFGQYAVLDRILMNAVNTVVKYECSKLIRVKHLLILDSDDKCRD